MQATFQVFGVNRFGNETKLNPVLRKEGEDVIVIVPKNLLDGRGFEFVRIVSSLTQARAGEKGYMFYPANFSYGVVRTDFIPREDCWIKSLISAMPVCGFCASEAAVYVQGLQMTSDLRFFSECRDGLYRIMPEFVLDGDDPDEDLAVLYRPMPGATYADMARVYRTYQMEVKGCVPLRQRAAERAALKQAAESMEIRIRRSEIGNQRLAMPDMQIAVGFGGKTGVHLLATPFFQILIDSVPDKICAFQFVFHNPISLHSSD